MQACVHVPGPQRAGVGGKERRPGLLCCLRAQAMHAFVHRCMRAHMRTYTHRHTYTQPKSPVSDAQRGLTMLRMIIGKSSMMTQSYNLLAIMRTNGTPTPALPPPWLPTTHNGPAPIMSRASGITAAACCNDLHVRMFRLRLHKSHGSDLVHRPEWCPPDGMNAPRAKHT